MSAVQENLTSIAGVEPASSEGVSPSQGLVAAAAIAGKMPALLASRHAVRVEFGRRWLTAELAAKLQPGSILELDGPADAVEVFADGRLVARGQSGSVDGRLCVRIGRVVRSGAGQANA